MSSNNITSDEGSSSRRSDEEKENSVEDTAPHAANNPADITEIKHMLDVLMKKAQNQEKFNEATTSKLQALSPRKRKRSHINMPRTNIRDRDYVMPPRTAHTDPEDLPPPPPRQESDETPERAKEASDEDKPPPRRRARTHTAGVNARAGGGGEPSIAELYQREQERRSPRGSRDEEIAALQAQLDKVVSDLKATQRQMHRSTAKAPGIAYVLEGARNASFTEKVARVQISNPAFVECEGGACGARNCRIESPGYGGSRGRGRERSRGNPTCTRGTREYDERLYCEFHQITGHSTARCREVGRQLAVKLTKGTLKGDINLSDLRPEEKAQGVTKVQTENPRRQRRGSDPEDGNPQGTMYMIMGGSQYCADNVTAIKAYQRRAEICANRSTPPRAKHASDFVTFDEEEVRTKRDRKTKQAGETNQPAATPPPF